MSLKLIRMKRNNKYCGNGLFLMFPKYMGIEIGGKSIGGYAYGAKFFERLTPDNGNCPVAVIK